METWNLVVEQLNQMEYIDAIILRVFSRVLWSCDVNKDWTPKDQDQDQDWIHLR